VPDKPIAARVHVLKPLEATTPRLVLHPGKEGEPITGVAEFASTYGEPITDVTVSVSREKRFTASIEPDSPVDTVRVRVTVNPPEKKKKPYVEGMLKVSAKVGGVDVDEKMTLVYAIAADGPGESNEMTADSDEPGNDTGRH
jgi:hypothetical protein